MALVKVASLPEMEKYPLIEASVGAATYAICKVDGKIYALDGTCPHRGGPLGQGALNGHQITCPWHAWEFDCRTGENDIDANLKVPVFEAHIYGDDILIDVR
jgi:nitrite reductase (NADH) small subunit